MATGRLTLLYRKLRRWFTPARVSIDVETRELSLGELMEAALNTDTLLTAGHRNLSTNDRAYLNQQGRRIDDELERRGMARYADL